MSGAGWKGIERLIVTIAESVCDADSAEKAADDAADTLLPRFSEHIYFSEQLGAMEYLCGAIYECTEGESFILDEMFQRAFGYADAESSRNLLFNLMNCAVPCLRTTVDPEVFGNVFDGLCSMAAEASSHGSLSDSDDDVVENLRELRNGSTGYFRDLDEDGYFSLVNRLEEDDSGELYYLLESLLGDRHVGKCPDAAGTIREFLHSFFDV